MVTSRLCCCWALVLVVVVAPSPQGVQAAPSDSSLDCGKEPETSVGVGQDCKCDAGCDVNQNLLCIRGRCLCQPDSVIFNQTCLLKSHYNESCTADPQCQDAHQWCDPAVGRCSCQPGFTETADSESHLYDICRPADGHGGTLGENCSSVADCSWQLEHVGCPSDLRVCRCHVFYYGEPGSVQCTERDYTIDWTWWIAICLIAAAIIAVGMVLILTCTIRECYRSHKRIRGRVIAIDGPVDTYNTPPPPYVAVINSKPPAYSPSGADENCMDNYGFTACELEPYPVKH